MCGSARCLGSRADVSFWPGCGWKPALQRSVTSGFPLGSPKAAARRRCRSVLSFFFLVNRTLLNHRNFSAKQTTQVHLLATAPSLGAGTPGRTAASVVTRAAAGWAPRGAGSQGMSGVHSSRLPLPTQPRGTPNKASPGSRVPRQGPDTGINTAALGSCSSLGGPLVRATGLRARPQLGGWTASHAPTTLRPARVHRHVRAARSPRCTLLPPTVKQ